MAYIWDREQEILRTNDNWVKEEYREIVYEESVHHYTRVVRDDDTVQEYKPKIVDGKDQFFEDTHDMFSRVRYVRRSDPMVKGWVRLPEPEMPLKEFCLALFYCDDRNVLSTFFEIKYTKEAELKKFMERLEKAFIIRYEDSIEDEREGDEFIPSRTFELMYEESMVTYTDKFETIQITIFDLKNQTRKFIVEFKARRDRTNFLNILDKAKDITLLDKT
jgi:hypothetical protein